MGEYELQQESEKQSGQSMCVSEINNMNRWYIVVGNIVCVCSIAV